MKDTTDSEKITYDSRDPIDFLGIPVHASQLVIQNGFYCPTQRLELPGFYPTLGSLVDANGRPISDDDGLTRLLTDIRFGVRDKIPRILQEAGKNNDFMLRRAHDIVVPLEFPKEGRKLEYLVGFLE